MNINYKVCSELLKAIAHPLRLQILKELMSGKKCVTDLLELVKTSQPNLSQHLKVLKKDNIIACKEEGKKRCYFITKSYVAPAFTILSACEKFSKWYKQNDK